jgi:hypothetical protein
MPSAQTAGALNALHTLLHRASPNGANATAAAAAAAAVTSDGSSTVTSTPTVGARVATPGSAAAADPRLEAFARSAGAAASGQGQLGLFEGYTSDIGMEGSQVGSAS